MLCRISFEVIINVFKLCSSRKYPYPSYGRSVEIPRRWGVSKAKILKGKYGVKLGERYGYFLEHHITFC